MKIKILGFGEIGRSLMEIYKDAGWFESAVAYKEIDYQKGDIDCNLLHVCIPFKNLQAFSNVVGDAIQESGCTYVVIHSTVAPGTTDFIQETYEKLVIVHSPVTGVHPNLAEGIRTFPRWIGTCADLITIRPILKHLHSLGLDMKETHVVSAMATELLKLMCTTYYGVCIAFHAEMQEILERNDIPWNLFAKWNQEYNEGYTRLGKPNVVRPVFPEIKLPFGGHCVVPNARILSRYYDSEFFELIKKYGE